MIDRDAYDDHLQALAWEQGRRAGAAAVRAQVEAVLEPAVRMDEKGYQNAASDALLGIHQALAEHA